MVIEVCVDAPEYMAQGIKESLAMWLEEHYGASEVLTIKDETTKPQQITLDMI